MRKSAGNSLPTLFVNRSILEQRSKLEQIELSDNIIVSVEKIQAQSINRLLFGCCTPSTLREEYCDRFPEV
jgi:hypothetical protein